MSRARIHRAACAGSKTASLDFTGITQGLGVNATGASGYRQKSALIRSHELRAHCQEPRAAATIAEITGQRIEIVLWQLRQLEDEGLIRHETDEAGVMRWSRVPVRVKGRNL